MRRAGLLASAALLAAGFTIAAPAQVAPPRLTELPAPEREALAGDFTIGAAGDIIYLRPMLATLEARTPGLIALLRAPDVTFGNFETSVFDLGSFGGAPQAESGGTWMLGDPGVVPDIAAMGFDIVGFANNHTTDWGVEGMRATQDALDAAGIVHAGTGATLSAARAPRYLDTAQGRIGLVSAASSFTPMSIAADPQGQVPGRGGLNPLRASAVRIVSAQQFATLAEVARTMGGKDRLVGDTVVLGGHSYRAALAGEAPGDWRFAIDEGDLAANLRSIRQASENGQFTVFSVHTHQPGNDYTVPADFSVELARAAIDAGADMVVGHGPHQLRGIEIYAGKPIFHSLGNFAMMNNSLDEIPADMYRQFGVTPGDAITTPQFLAARNKASFSNPAFFESVVAHARYRDGDLREVRLFPITLGSDAKAATKGVPVLAGKADAVRILRHLAALSAPMGTSIRIEGSVGVIALD